MTRRDYTVGDRVDGLYDGNSDDVWYPGFITTVHGDSEFFDVLYDDGEAEQRVAPEFLRVHQHSTICVGSRVYGRYAGGDEWYAGKIQEVLDDGTFTIAYDDGEVEASVSMEFIRETLISAVTTDDEEREPVDAAREQDEHPEAPQHAPEAEEEKVAQDVDHPVASDVESIVAGVANVEVADAETRADVSAAESETNAHADADASAPAEPSRSLAEESKSVEAPDRATSRPEESVHLAGAHYVENEAEEPPKVPHYNRPNRRMDEEPIAVGIAPVENESNGVVDEYSKIQSTIEKLEHSAGDAGTTKTLLSTLVKQMRAFPQATADLVHSRGGEGLLMEILKQHHTHAVIQCYGFVLLRRLCFLCGKSTHFFLRNGIVDLVTIAMRKFPEDAILQASACGALAVFTRVHAGLSALLENRVSHLVLATIIFHKSYSVHTRQVHYYACEVLLELCELGDKTTIEALCGDGISGPGLSDLSPISLLLFLLRQALSYEDKKACCAAGTLLMCLASCHRHAAEMVLDLNGLGELSTVMAKFPMELGIQKYAASASKEIALCSMDQGSPHRHVQRAAHNVLGESNSLEDLHHQRQIQQQRPGGAKAGGNSKSGGAKRKAPASQRGGVSSMNGFPFPANQQQVGPAGINSRDALSFSKFTSPIGKAPHLPPNIRSFGEANGAPSPSAAMYHHQLQQQQRHQVGSPLVILDSHGAMTSDKKRFVKDERTNLLFETYGVDAKSALPTTHSNEHHVRTHGIKRRQLKTHIVSASTATSPNDGISWASPVKSIILQDSKPLSSRSEKHAAKALPGETRKVHSSGGQAAVGLSVEEEQTSPATLRRQQPQLTAKAGKKQDSEVKTPRSTSFQLKIDTAQATADSGGMASPIVVSSNSGRQGVGSTSSRSKVVAKSNSSKASARTATTSRAVGMGSNASTESLNSYATQLFKDEIEASAKPSCGASAAQERERMSFAEKLHKMIDKAKSSLAHGSTVSLASEAQSSPVKTTKRPEPVQPASAKKKQAQPSSASTSRVAPASLKSSAASTNPTVPISTADITAPKKPPTVVPKPTPAKKPTAIAAATQPIASKHVVLPKSTRASGATPTRAAPVASSTPMKSTSSATSGKPAGTTTKSASANKSAGSSKTSKSPDIAAAASAAAVIVTATTAIDANQESPSSVQVVSPEDTVRSEAFDEQLINEPAARVVKDQSDEASIILKVGADSAPTEVPDPVQVSPPSDPVTPANGSTLEIVDNVAVAKGESAPTDEVPTAPADSTPAEATTVEAALEEAAAVATSAADELYADEYNDFDDLDNAPQTLDDEGVDIGGEMGRDGSFEALMNLTAQVTEFTVATETVIDADVPQADADESHCQAAPEAKVVDEDSDSPGVSATPTNASTEPVPTVLASSDESNGEPEQDRSDVVVTSPESDSTLRPLQSEESSLEAEVIPSPPEIEGQGQGENAERDEKAQEMEATTGDSNDAEVSAAGEDDTNHEDSAEASKGLEQEPVNEEQLMDDAVAQEADEQNNRVSIPVETDRPESRQTDASYADEDFDDSPEAAEDYMAVEMSPEAKEVAQATNTFALATFALAEPPAQLTQDCDSAAAIDAPLLTQDEMPTAEPPADESAEVVQANISQVDEDDYGDADFAGDESVPTSDEHNHPEDDAPANAPAQTIEDAVAAKAEAAVIPADAPEAGDTEEISSSTATEESAGQTIAVDDRQIPGDAQDGLAFEANGVNAEVHASQEKTTVDGARKEATLEEASEPSPTVPVESTGVESVAAPGDLLVSDTTPAEHADERVTTSDMYDDTAVDDDASIAAERETEEVVEDKQTAANISPIELDALQDAPELEVESPAQDGVFPGEDNAEVTGGNESTPESDEVQSSKPATIGVEDDAQAVVSTATDNVDVQVDPAEEPHSILPSDDLPPLDGDGKEDTEEETAPSPPEEPRPATAADYDNEGFDESTPREDQVPTEQTAAVDEKQTISTQDDMIAVEASACAENVRDGRTDLVVADDEEASVPLMQVDTARPTTADAYADEADFEDPVESEEGEKSPVEATPTASSTERTESADLVVADDEEASVPLMQVDTARPTTADAYADEADFEDAVGSEEGEKSPVEATPTAVTEGAANDTSMASEELVVQHDIESLAGCPQGNDDLLMRDASELLVDSPIEIDADVPSDSPKHAVEVTSIASDEAESPLTVSTPTAEEDATALEPRPATPREETKYDDDAIVDNDSDNTSPPESADSTEGVTEENAVEDVNAYSSADVEEEDGSTRTVTDDSADQKAVPQNAAEKVFTDDSKVLVDDDGAGEVEISTTEQPPVAAPDDTDSTMIADVVDGDHENPDAAESSPLAEPAQDEAVADEPARSETAQSPEGESLLLNEAPVKVPEPATSAEEQPTSDNPADSLALDTSDGQAVVPSDGDLPKGEVSEVSGVSSNDEPSPDGIEPSPATEYAQPVEPATEFEVHNLPAETSEELHVDSEAPSDLPVAKFELHHSSADSSEELCVDSEAPSNASVDVNEEKNGEPEERVTETARTDPEGAYGKDGFDEAAGEQSPHVTEHDNAFEHEERELSLADEPPTSGETMTIPSDEVDDVVVSVEDKEAAAVVIEHEDTLPSEDNLVDDEQAIVGAELAIESTENGSADQAELRQTAVADAVELNDTDVLMKHTNDEEIVSVDLESAEQPQDNAPDVPVAVKIAAEDQEAEEPSLIEGLGESDELPTMTTPISEPQDEVASPDVFESVEPTAMAEIVQAEESVADTTTPTVEKSLVLQSELIDDELSVLPQSSEGQSVQSAAEDHEPTVESGEPLSAPVDVSSIDAASNGEPNLPEDNSTPAMEVGSVAVENQGAESASESADGVSELEPEQPIEMVVANEPVDAQVSVMQDEYGEVSEPVEVTSDGSEVFIQPEEAVEDAASPVATSQDENPSITDQPLSESPLETTPVTTDPIEDAEDAKPVTSDPIQEPEEAEKACLADEAVGDSRDLPQESILEGEAPVSKDEVVSETVKETSVNGEAVGDSHELPQESTLDDQAPVQKDEVVSETVEEAKPVAVPTAPDDDEVPYNADENEFDEDTTASPDPSPPGDSVAAVSSTPADSAPSPSVEDTEYDDFETNEPPSPAFTSARIPAVETAKLVKQHTKDDIDDETAYADEDDAYNDFEDDETPRTVTAPAVQAATAIPADDMEDAYDMEETFDEEDKKPSKVPVTTSATTGATAPTADEVDYEDEYDEFED